MPCIRSMHTTQGGQSVRTRVGSRFTRVSLKRAGYRLNGQCSPRGGNTWARIITSFSPDEEGRLTFSGGGYPSQRNFGLNVCDVSCPTVQISHLDHHTPSLPVCSVSQTGAGSLSACFHRNYRTA